MTGRDTRVFGFGFVVVGRRTAHWDGLLRISLAPDRWQVPRTAAARLRTAILERFRTPCQGTCGTWNDCFNSRAVELACSQPVVLSTSARVGHIDPLTVRQRTVCGNTGIR